MSKNFLSGHRNWNILAFRGRLMSLLELRSAGSHRGLWDWDCALLVPSKTIAITRPTENISSHRTRKASAAIHRTQKKRFSFSRSLAYSICWDGFSFIKDCFTIFIRCTSVYYSLIRSTTSLIGTEGGDSWVWDCALLVPSKTIAITRPTENICGNSKRSSVGRTIVQSHGP